jgi:hypothetical protein
MDFRRLVSVSQASNIHSVIFLAPFCSNNSSKPAEFRPSENIQS